MRHISISILLNLFLLVQAQQKEVKLLFAGDAMQHLPQVEAAKTEYGYEYDSCFYLLKDKISTADLACVNFETSLGGPPYRGYPMFSSPDEFAISLKNTGFDIFFLANNHILDSRKKGLERTIDILDSIKIKHIGAYKSKQSKDLHYPLIVIKNGIRIAFLNYTYDTNGINITPPNIVNIIDTTQIINDIQLAKRYSPDIIIANMHWGIEYSTKYSKEQEKLSKLLIDNGVRIIIGNHPHVIQPIVRNVKDNKIESVIYYSLGNFISNQRNKNTDGGAIAEINIRKNDNTTEIVSCDYSLIWVKRLQANDKFQYTIIPIEADEMSNLSNDELESIRIFETNAKNIIERRKSM